MLSRLRQFVFRRSTCNTAVVDRRLGLEAAEARVSPPPGLRPRTLAALREATLQPSGTRSQRRSVVFANAFACGVLVLIAAATVLYVAPLRPPPARIPAARPLKRLSFDTVRWQAAVEQRLHIGEDSWETPLRQEARLIVADARQAREYLLARLPRAPGG
jgi:hypothetical protein